VEIKSITVQKHPGQNISETVISTNKLGVVVLICNLSYVGNYRLEELGQRPAPSQNTRPYLKNNLKKTGLDVLLKW
jgi:hypothetical protein